VRFLGLTYKKAMDQPASALLRVTLRARDGDCRHNRIGPERKTADSVRIEMMLMHQIKNGESGQTAAFRVQCSGAAVDVVIATRAGGELKVAELEGLAGEQREKLLAR
jgi:hypothetical protein